MQQNEQGFAEQSLSTLVDFNYSPCSIKTKPFQSRSLHMQFNTSNNNHISNNINKNNQLNTSPFINQQLRQNWITQSIKKIDHIVFNNFAKESVTYSQKHISFDSSFQSGNLDLVSKKRHHQYQLYMRPDTNTQTHFQWFFFKVAVKKSQQTKKITFIIKNFIKSGMMYSEGLRPYYSQMMNLNYKQINTPVQFYFDQDSQYYTLKFSFVFPESASQFYFSSQPPYTFKSLCKFLKTLNTKQLTLGFSVLGQTIPYIIYREKQKCKGVAIAIARQHPGQSVGSWVMQGFIKQIQDLRQLNPQICWVIIPMLNIDGVILGNNRTGALGHDFNRNWNIQQKGLQKQTLKRQKMFPQNSAVLNLIKKIRKQYRGKLKLFLDFHGHSSQPNFFSYGPVYQNTNQMFYISRIFSQFLQKKNQYFSLEQSSFCIQPQKKNTLRSILNINLGIPYVYTVQSSFGVLRGKKAIDDDYKNIGKDIANTANQFLNLICGKSKKNNILLDKIIQQIKIKNEMTKNISIKQFDSGSQASDQTPVRIKFEQKITNLLMKDTQSTKMKQKKLFLKEKDLIDGKHLNFKIQRSFDGRIQTQCSITMPRKNLQNIQRNNTRFKTELAFKRQDKITSRYLTNNIQQDNYKSLNYDKYKLPNIQKPSKQIYGKRQRVISLMSPQKFDLKSIHGKLYDARNAKIGKKILVINALEN